MVALTEKERQVLDLIGSLSPDRQRLLLYELAKDSDAAWQRNTTLAESQLRSLAAARGLTWDQLNDEQRQDFVCGLLHEDDRCLGLSWSLTPTSCSRPSAGRARRAGA